MAKDKKKQSPEKLILERLRKAGKDKNVSYKDLQKAVRKKNYSKSEFREALNRLMDNGQVFMTGSSFNAAAEKDLKLAEVVKLQRTFGFVKPEDNSPDIFIPGKKLMGAMPGDIVLVRLKKSRGESPEGIVIRIEQENFCRFTGEITMTDEGLMVKPDSISNTPIRFTNPMQIELNEGDKVLAHITHRGESHHDHLCEIAANYGSSQKAAVCALSVLEMNGLTPLFPNEVIFEARQANDESRVSEGAEGRLDLRDKPIFTIDGADTKDIDDAVSVEKNEEGYLLGVHIADVSHYVKPKSALDNEAFRRGTSVYYANRVIPMLPKELSNGICSLNPGVDRLAFSCLCQLDKNGVIRSYRFVKTVIRSRVKGVYSEINELLEGYKSKASAEKYKDVLDQLPVMKKLADILAKNVKKRGAPQLETVEAKLIINAEDKCVGAEPKQRGESEELIENFMLVANECAARFATENSLPFVYRIHEVPSEEKTETLKELLTKLGIQFKFGERPTPADMAKILEQAKGSDIFPMINNIVLRSMSKARYSTEPVGHFGLALADYTHFTSPIRRYPDLAIHRIMSERLAGTSVPDCQSRFNKFVYAAADQATRTELTAIQTERDCEDCYKAEYMAEHIGEEFDGRIVSVVNQGIFVGLDNTCEGLVRNDSLPEGEYELDYLISLTDIRSGRKYSVGDPVRVKVVNANVSAGNIDFEFV